VLSRLFIELGAAIAGLAILARIASRWGIPVIPLYLLAGLAFGKGGIAPLNFSAEFIHVGAEIGILLLLFLLGLEHTGEELRSSLQAGLGGAAIDFALNFPPGLIAGLMLAWPPLPAVLLGGITYISSSGIVAKTMAEPGSVNGAETPSVLSILVSEDLAMAIFLPLVAVMLAGGNSSTMLRSTAIAVGAAAVALLGALHYGERISRLLAHESDEVILLSTLGVMLLAAGFAERLRVSAAIGAFLVGTALSDPIARPAHRLLAPLRDLFAAVFFLFFGLEVDPGTLLPVLPLALGLGVVTAATKILGGYWAAGRTGADRRSRWSAGVMLVPRGEFSIVLAGLGAAREPQLGPLAAAYVLLLAILGPLLGRAVKKP
jgi:CPA2 family monovalent cation:H+ antiporter-2